jgi:hypothetical protein
MSKQGQGAGGKENEEDDTRALNIQWMLPINSCDAGLFRALLSTSVGTSRRNFPHALPESRNLPTRNPTVLPGQEPHQLDRTEPNSTEKTRSF